VERETETENCELYYALIIDAHNRENIYEKIKTKLKGGKIGIMRDKEKYQFEWLECVFCRLGEFQGVGLVMIGNSVGILGMFSGSWDVLY